MNRGHLDNFHNDEGASHGITYHTELRELSQGIVLKLFFNSDGKL